MKMILTPLIYNPSSQYYNLFKTPTHLWTKLDINTTHL